MKLNEPGRHTRGVHAIETSFGAIVVGAMPFFRRLPTGRYSVGTTANWTTMLCRMPTRRQCCAGCRLDDSALQDAD